MQRSHISKRQKFSVIIRNPNEVPHRRGLNSIVVDPQSKDESFVFTASRDRLIKLWQVNHAT